MSKATWMAEFYPVPTSQVPESEAIAHSMRKWSGLLRPNLARHGLKSAPISTNTNTCALCFHFYEAPTATDERCLCCPLTLVRGTACDMVRTDEEISPYAIWKRDNDPLPMLGWLAAALQHTRATPKGTL